MIKFFLLVFLICTNSHAAKSYLSFGYGRGGDELRDATGGQNYSIKAGDGLSLMVGKIITISDTKPHGFEAQLGLGYMFQDDGNSKEGNQVVSWRRIPIELVYFYNNTRELFRLGYGAIFHTNNRIDGDGMNASASAKARDAWGMTFAAEKVFKSSENPGIWSMGLRYQMIEYSSSTFSKKVDGDTLSFTLSALFE